MMHFLLGAWDFGLMRDYFMPIIYGDSHTQSLSILWQRQDWFDMEGTCISTHTLVVKQMDYVF